MVTAFTATDTTDRHRDYLDDCAQLQVLWDKRIAHRKGPLPGALLTPVRTPHGWCGQVQLFPGRHSTSDVRDAADHIAAVYGLPAGSVVVDDGVDETADTAFIWAYRSPSGADYHEHWPMTINGQPFAGELSVVGRPTRFDWSELRDWAHKYRHCWKVMQERGRIVDVERFVRRLQRLRAGIIDAVPQTKRGEIRALLEQQGITAEMLPDDLAEFAGLCTAPLG